MTNTVREYTGGYIVVPVQWTFPADATAGAFGTNGLVAGFEAPAAGFVVGLTVTGTGGNFSGCTWLMHLPSAVAASALTVNGAAEGYITFKPGVLPFAAGALIRAKIDALTTMRACTLTALLLMDLTSV